VAFRRVQPGPWSGPEQRALIPSRPQGEEPVAEVFSRVPVAGMDTAEAFLGPWRLMSVDGMEWEVPDTAANRAAFGSKGGSQGQAAFPAVRVVTVSECASHARCWPRSARWRAEGHRGAVPVQGPVPGAGGGLAADRVPELLRLAGHCTASDAGADLLWRVTSYILLPVLELPELVLTFIKLVCTTRSVVADGLLSCGIAVGLAGVVFTCQFRSRLRVESVAPCRQAKLMRASSDRTRAGRDHHG
jgi:hypothetical protein